SIGNSGLVSALPLAPPRPRPRLVDSTSPAIAPKPPSVPPPLPKKRVASLTMKPASVPRPAPSVRAPATARLRGAVLVEAIVAALREMPDGGDAPTAARFCLDTLARILPCRAAIVHLFDPSTREFFVIHARG